MAEALNPEGFFFNCGYPSCGILWVCDTEDMTPVDKIINDTKKTVNVVLKKAGMGGLARINIMIAIDEPIRSACEQIRRETIAEIDRRVMKYQDEVVATLNKSK